MTAALEWLTQPMALAAPVVLAFLFLLDHLDHGLRRAFR